MRHLCCFVLMILHSGISIAHGQENPKIRSLYPSLMQITPSESEDPIYPSPFYNDECDFIRRQIIAGATIDLVPERDGDGVYECKGPIVIDENDVILRGPAEERVTLRLANQTVKPLLVIGSVRTGDAWDTTDRVVQRVLVENLNLDGNRFGQIELADLALRGDVNGRLIEEGAIVARQQQAECWSEDPQRPLPCDRSEFPVSKIRNNAVTIRGAQQVTVRNVSVYNALSGGMVTEKFSSHLTVENFESYGNFYDGFAGYDTNQSSFSHLHLHHNRASGASLDLNFNDNIFSSSRFSNNLDNGIFARDSSSNRFVEVTIDDVCNNGIFLAGLPRSPEHGGAVNYYFENLNVRAADRGFHVADLSCSGTKLNQQSLQNIYGYAEDISGHPDVLLEQVAWVSDASGQDRLVQVGTIDFRSPGERSHNRTQEEIWAYRMSCVDRNRSTPFVDDLKNASGRY